MLPKNLQLADFMQNRVNGLGFRLSREAFHSLIFLYKEHQNDKTFFKANDKKLVGMGKEV